MGIEEISDIYDPPNPAPSPLTERISWVVYFSWIGCLMVPNLIYYSFLYPAETYDLIK